MRNLPKGRKAYPQLWYLNHPQWEPMPDAGYCRKCDRWDMAHPEVQRVMEERREWWPSGTYNIMLDEARCKCADYEQQRLKELNERIYNANLPVRYDSTEPRTFGSFDNDARGTAVAYSAVEAWARGLGERTLVLIGGTGTGKSHLAEAALREGITHGWSARFEFTAVLLDKLRPGGDDNADVIKPCMESRFLVLDDIGLEKPSDFVREKLAGIIEERVRAGLFTLCTTNLTPQEIRERLGDRIHSRLFGTNAGSKVVVMKDAQDYRMRR